MLFNSIEFLIFLPTVFLLYWYVLANHLRLQNLLVLVASYIFYGWWDWRFLGLLLISTAVDFTVGLVMAQTSRKNVRTAALVVSLVTNLGMLGFFKYWNFFIESWIGAWSTLGVTMNLSTVQIILPVGISFYSFQTLSYAIDVYRRDIQPTRDPVVFAAFVAFFPQLVAGPIERAANLLPQFLKPRVFSYADGVEGLRQILWGMFKKVVIADQLAAHVNLIHATYQSQPGIVLLLGAIFFAFQIYCDFSGYSDIAIGTARLFGFKLMVNFRYPYFSRDIGEFWRRWHISLSTWFRDYLFMPLGGTRGGKLMTMRNIAIVFVTSGFWHGAKWTFVAWGALHALYFMPLILIESQRRYPDNAAEGKIFPRPAELIAILRTFLAVAIALVIFRANSLRDAFAYIGGMIPDAGFFGGSLSVYLPALGLIGMLVCFEWAYRTQSFPLSHPRWPWPVRQLVYFGLFYWTLVASEKGTEFIYFQF